jgi:hypothetical protein
MDPINYQYAKAHHQLLLQAAEAARLAAAANPGLERPFSLLLDRFCLWFGGVLVTAGNWLRRRSSAYKPAEEVAAAYKLVDECA